MSESSEHTDGIDRAKRGRMLFVVVLGAAVAATVVFGAIQLSGGGVSAPPAADSTSNPPSPTPESTETSATVEGDANGGDVTPTLKPTGDILPEDLAGQEAIDALGDDIVLVAERSGKTVEELKELLLRDETVRVSTDGFLYYVDPSHG